MSILALVLIVSCGEDEGTMPEEEQEEEEVTEEAESWVLVDADSFFVASATALPTSSGPFRYQINFATREQLTQTGNDGNVQSTFAIGLAFESRPTSTGTFTFTSDRFSIASDELNLYQSFFTGTGHPRAEQNYLSTDGVSVDISIQDGKLTSDLGSLTMFQEGNDSETFTLKWSLNLNW